MMQVSVHTNTYTHATTHVANGVARSIKQIVVRCGLDPAKLIGVWTTIEDGLSTWLKAMHLKYVVLEVVNPLTDQLVKRFDFEIRYRHDPLGTGDLWLDPRVVEYAVRKAGVVPHQCTYRIVAITKPGCAAVDGWTSTQLRMANHLCQKSVGSAVGGGGIAAFANYWK